MPYTADTSRQVPYSVLALAGINCLIGAGVLFAWPALAPRLAGPIGWAFGHSLSTYLPVWEMPFLMMWASPFAIAAAGWLLDAVDHTPWAIALLLLPPAAIATTMVLFRHFG
jgi:hypothetical protein